MRAPLNRLSTTQEPTKVAVSRKPKPQDNMHSNMAMLLILLAFTCIACFMSAYYLFTTRWERRPATRLQLADTSTQALGSPSDPASWSPESLYLAYLPHSGFHNQRIAFENAIILAHILNRTLLVPPIRLGNRPIRYVRFDRLHQFLVLSDKKGLDHCSKVPAYIAMPAECLYYFDYALLPWDWLVNLTSISTHKSFLFRWDMSDSWIHEQLRISLDDRLVLQDDSPYQYRFLDAEVPIPPSNRYTTDVYISDLAQSTARIIQIGTLFGTSRLYLKRKDNVLFRKDVRRAMVYSNPELASVADKIARILAGTFLGVHLRLGDGAFKLEAERNSRVIWWQLVHRVLNFSADDALSIETNYATANGTDSSHDKTPHLLLSDPRITELPIKLSHPQLPCRGKLHQGDKLSPLNIPVYISTDAKELEGNPFIATFTRTFPCTYFITDFVKETQELGEASKVLEAGFDTMHLLPFIDAMVVGRAWRVVGTEGSTFSKFVKQILWPVYSGNITVF